MIEMNWKARLKWIIISIVIFAASQFALTYVATQLPNKIKFIVGVIAIVVFFVLARFSKAEKLGLNAFLIIVLIGGAACVIKPIQYGLDEETHIIRVIQMADGQLFSREHMDIPDLTEINRMDVLRAPAHKKGVLQYGSSIPRVFLEKTHQPASYSGKITSMNNPAYIPNAIGWDIGRLFSNRLFVSYYLGRLFNVLAYAGLAFLAFRIAKKYREVLFLFATFPTVIWGVSGYSYDWLYFGLSLILLAQLSNIFSSKEKLSRKQIVQVMLVSCLMTFPKFPFILMGAVVLLLPKARYHAKDRIFAGGAFLVSLIIGGLWYQQGTIISKLVPIPPAPNTMSWAAVNPDLGQPVPMTYWLTHPAPILRTLISDCISSIGSFTGLNAGQVASDGPLTSWQYPSIFLAITCVLTFIILFLIVSLRLEVQVSKQMKGIIWGFFFVITIAIIYAMSKDYRVGYRAGQYFIDGVQSRYFFLMFLTLPLLLKDKIQKVFQANLDKAYISFLPFSMMLLNVFVMGIAMYSLVAINTSLG